MTTTTATRIPAPPRFTFGDDDDDDLLEARHEIYGYVYLIRFKRSEKPEALRQAMRWWREKHYGDYDHVQMAAAIREASGEVRVPGIGWVDG